MKKIQYKGAIYAEAPKTTKKPKAIRKCEYCGRRLSLKNLPKHCPGCGNFVRRR